MDGIITIDVGSLILTRDKAGELTLTPDATMELAKILEAKKVIEGVYAYVQGILSQKMSDHHIKKIVSDNIVVRNSMYGEKYIVTDEADPQFTKTVQHIKPNSETIEKYIDEHGQPPVGVSLKDRLPTATIKFRDE